MRIPGDVRERLQLVHRNSLRLLKLVNSLLDFSRIEAGRAQASYEPIDLAALTRDLASTFRSAIERGRRVSFDVACDDLREPVYVDRDMGKDCAESSLERACKFTFQGSITIALRREGDEAVLDVEDTGVGVPAAELPRLFERFHRIESTRARTHEGSGIGLALVKELAKLHGGAIAATSELDKGTTFTVRVPLGSAHLPADRLKAPLGGASTGIGARAFVRGGRCAGCRRRSESCGSKTPPNCTARAQCGWTSALRPPLATGSSLPTTTPTCAHTCKACSAPAIRSRSWRTARKHSPPRGASART